LFNNVHIAETSSSSVKLVEEEYFENASPIFNKAFKSAEAGCVRLVRTACKALQYGGDDKSGCHKVFLEFVKPFLSSHGIRTLPLTTFRGNRFNVLFENAAPIYFLHQEIRQFLEGNATNQLLKSILHDLNVPFFLAGCKALGLISCLLTQPLWSVIESKRHIFDIGQLYHKVILFTEDSSLNIPSFMCGELVMSHIDPPESHSPIFSSLIAPSDHEDHVEVILTVMLPAILKVLQHIFADFLPGGKWEAPTQEMRTQAEGELRRLDGIMF
jgi:E1A/CREB-binding protein